MGTKALYFVLGLAIGAAVCAAILGKKARGDTAASVATAGASMSNQVADLQSELAAARGRLDASREENDRLTAKAQELMRPAAAPATEQKPAKRTGLAALFGGDGTNELSEAMSDMMKSALEQQVEGKVMAMKSHLKLPPEQETAIRDILNKQMGKGVEIAQRMFKGDLSKEELEQAGKPAASERDEIKAVLTPEQLAAYDDYERDEKSRMARLIANSELLQIQSSLQLTEEQQDKVFAVLVERAQKQFDPENAVGGADYRAQTEAKTEALRGVLSAEQFERYQKHQEQQLKLIESFMPKSGTNRNIQITPVIKP